MYVNQKIKIRKFECVQSKCELSLSLARRVLTLLLFSTILFIARK